MKGKRFLNKVLTCGLSVLMLQTPSFDMVFAQNLSQDTENVVTEVEEVSETGETETEEVMAEQDTENDDVQEEFENTQSTDEKVEEEVSETLENVTVANVAKGTDGDISWSLDSKGALTITGTGSSKNRPWLEYKDQIETARVKVSKITSMSDFFNGCGNLISIDFSKSDFSECTDMSGMFSSCFALKQLDMSNFDTGNVTNMSRMFYYCTNLTQLDVSNFNTSSVTNMSKMFYHCNNLKQLDLKQFDTSSVTNMSGMFGDCLELVKIKGIENMDTSNVTDMSYMFSGCSGLTQLDVSNFDTGNVKNMSYMFGSFDKSFNVAKLDVSKFNTSNVKNMSWMFSGCSNVTQLDVRNFDTSNVKNMSWMFRKCSNLSKLDLSNFNTSKVTNMYSMFADCSNLAQVDVSNFDTGKVTNISFMFSGCSSLKKLNLSSFDLGKVQDLSGTFNNCTSLQNLYTPKNVLVTVSLPTTFYDASGKSYTTLPMSQNSSIHLTTTKNTNQPVTYKVIFNGNGATGGSMKEQSITYGSGTKLTANTYTHKGYIFNGWNTKADGKGVSYEDKADGSKLTKKNGSSVTLYAQWKKKNYTITYNLNSGTNTKENPAKYNVKTATITLKNPTRKGYTFKGWYTDSNYKNQITQIKKGSTGNKTLYAKWAANKYTVTFDANNKKATGKTKAISCKYGKKYTLTSNGFKRKGYTFKGWNTKKDGSGKTYKNKAEIKNLTTKSNGKVVLYAQWKKKK